MVALPLYWEYSKSIERQGHKMSYTSGRSVKSTARKLATGLTVQKATRDARRIIEQVMPGVGVTVTSRISWDFDSDRQTVVTTITHPTDHAGAFALWAALFALPNVLRNGSRDSARMVITRTV
jgi:hypothetical protein